MMGNYYLDAIKSGIKTHEGRVYREKCAELRVGDILIFQGDGRGIKCIVTNITKFASFHDMLSTIGTLNMLPQLADFAKTASSEELLAEGVRIYMQFPGAEDVRQLGCAAIGVQFIADC